MLDVGIGEPLEVVELDLLLHRDAALAQPRQQRFRPGLQPDHEVGLAQLRGDRRVHLRIEPVLLVAERQLGEDRVLGEHEVADHALAEHARLGHATHLALALEQEEQLGLERIARHVVVEAVEERVLGRLLEHQLGADAASQQVRQRRLAGADRPLDGDVAKSRDTVAHAERNTK